MNEASYVFEGRWLWMIMFFSAMVLVISTALFFFYVQTVCQKTLRREFARPYFQSIIATYRLEFHSALKGLELASGQRERTSLYTRLRVDFVVLDCLMRQTGTDQRRSFGERLLRLSFRAGLAALAVRQCLGLESRKTTGKLATILQYFSNIVGERLNQTPLANLTPSEYIASL